MERLSHTAVYICHLPYFFLLPALTPIVPFHQSPLNNLRFCGALHKQGSLKATLVVFFLFLRIEYFAMSDGRIVDKGEMKLMLPPPPRPPKMASTPQQQVLDEDTYTSDIEAIIE